MDTKDDTKADAAQAARNRAPRTSTLMVAQCLREDGTQAALKVRNLSATGFKADCPDIADFAVDEQVRIGFKNLSPVWASVVWFDGSEVAFKFRNPVDLERINRARTMGQNSALSPRSDAVSNWIDRNNQRQEWERLAKGIRGTRPL
jgi:hypothetical protein